MLRNNNSYPEYKGRAAILLMVSVCDQLAQNQRCRGRSIWWKKAVKFTESGTESRERVQKGKW